jgi:hypothetical protein
VVLSRFVAPLALGLLLGQDDEKHRAFPLALAFVLVLFYTVGT